MSLRAAGELLGIGHSRLSEIERGSTYRSGAPTGPSRDLVERMAKVYGEPRGTLLERAGYHAARPDLSAPEAELLDLFRDLSDFGQALVVDIVRAAREYMKR
ncbi:MAG: helix-turn-helix transcriptional regulator [Cyanobacteria bacterium REEB65]|nr:helix-turn-helix transcriptional regulator [Cyanobacteria bacterium REEB65]